MMAFPQGPLFIFLFLFIAITLVQGQCPSPQYVDGAPPAGPSFASSPLPDALAPVVDNIYNPLTENHYSEKANLAAYRAPKVTPTLQQTECPHKRSGLKNWHDADTWGGAIPGNNADVTIPANTQVLIASCSIDPSFILGIITVPPTSALIFSDANISINARGFNVKGALYAGSPTCRLRSKVTITLHGRRSNQKLPAAEQVKGIAVTGSIDFHGAQYTPTWTRLAMTAKPNDTWIFVQDRINWQPGQLIVITTTELKDSRDWHRNEERRILAIRTTKLGDSVTAIQIDSPLSYKHFGGREYQAEVSLLSRNILVQGDPTNSEPTDDSPVACSHTNTQSSTYPCENSFLTGFGAHIIVYGNTSQGRFSGVEVFRGGQTNVLGRYPIHFHLMGDQTSFNYTSAYAQDCSVHHSYFRCFAIHGSHGVRLSENTAYNAIGHCFFLEDGVEENNILSFNQAAHIHPLGPYQNPSLGLNGDGWGGQYLSYYNQTDNLILPSDMAAGCFYITNNYNDFIGNAASGGWAGFSMPALPLPVKLFVNTTGISPANRPFRTPFRGNSAHSSGFWWATAGGIYVGGELTQPGGFLGNLTYTSGRSSVRNTCTVKDSSRGCNRNDYMWLRFEDNKVFLSNRGMQNWGNRAEIVRFELHDVSLAMNVFGRVWIDSMLMECRTLNHQPTWLAGCPTAPAQSRNPPSVSARCNIRDYTFWNTFGGFQWYDVGQMHILTDSTFRNCRNDWTYCFGNAGNCSSTAVFTSLTHSDQFVPELMQITSGIKYENVTDLWRYSTALSYKGGITVSGRLQNWLDYDGTASQMGSRAMIGSARANDWWKYNDDCNNYIETWRCKMAPLDSSASFIIKHNPTLENEIGKTLCMNGNNDGTKPCPLIGMVSHFGSTNESAGLELAVNAKISGPLIYSSGGWFIRFTEGTPGTLTFTSLQIYAEDILLLAIPYPAGTTFNLTYNAPSWCNSANSDCVHPYHQVNSVEEVVNAYGDAYHWSEKDRTLYFRMVYAAENFGAKGKGEPIWEPSMVPPALNFSRGGRTLTAASSTVVTVKAMNCDTNPCRPQQDVNIPPALRPGHTSSTTTTADATTVASTTGPGNDMDSSTSHTTICLLICLLLAFFVVA